MPVQVLDSKRVFWTDLRNLILALIFLYLVTNAHALNLTISTTQNNQNVIGVDSDTRQRYDAQYFRFGSSIVIMGVTFKLHQDNAAAPIVISLRDGPSSSIQLVNGSTSDFSMGVGRDYNISFGTGYTIQANRDYVLYVACPSCSGTNNNYYIGWDGTHPYTDGGLTDWSGLAWVDRNATFDLVMTLHYDEIPSGGAPPDLNLTSNMVNGSVVEDSFKLDYNGTVFNSTDLFNCSLFVDSVVNESEVVNVSVNQDITLTFAQTIASWKNLTLNCWNSATSDNVSAWYYFNYTVVPSDTGSCNASAIAEILENTEEFDMLWYWIFVLVLFVLAVILASSSRFLAAIALTGVSGTMVLYQSTQTSDGTLQTILFLASLLVYVFPLMFVRD